MNVLSGFPHDHCHNLNGPGAYEWWYVDALDATGEWGVVLILFRGMPMSPDYLCDPSSMHAGYALSVYHRGVRIAFAFGGHALEYCRFESDVPGVSMPSGGMVVDETELRMHIDAPCGGDARRARVMVRMPVSVDQEQLPWPQSDGHAWILAAPRLRADVNIAIDEQHGPVVRHEFSALAYHDHNMGSRSMPSDYRDWYWGRVHGKDSSYVFLATPNSPDTSAWFGRVTADGLVIPLRNPSMKLARPRISMLGLFHHRSIQFSGIDDEGHEHLVTCHNRVVCEDGPFYQRYISTWQIGATETALGMSEYMNVQRLSSPWIRPFLRLPWVVSS